MNILDEMTEGQAGVVVSQLGSQLGLDTRQTKVGLAALAPLLAAGFQRNLRTPGGLAGLVTALAGGDHQRYLSDPAALSGGGAVADGNGILGHVLGSKDVSRAVAARASELTGLPVDVLQQMLPLAAAVMMGTFAQQRASGGSPSMASLGGGGSLLDLLGGLADRNQDGSAADDLAGMFGRLLGR